MDRRIQYEDAELLAYGSHEIFRQQYEDTETSGQTLTSVWIA
jgi:hypothetical protein